MYEYGEIRIHLDELIKSSGLSKKRFSIQANMQRSQINHFCNNQITRFDADVLTRICSALNCQINDLLEYIPPENSLKDPKIES